MTKVLIKCHNERPENPIEFIKENISASIAKEAVIEDLKQKLEAADKEILNLSHQLESLRMEKQLHQLRFPTKQHLREEDVLHYYSDNLPDQSASKDGQNVSKMF